MCVVSMIGDYFDKYWEKPWTNNPPIIIDNNPPTNTFPIVYPLEEIKQLRKELEAVKELLKQAIKVDKITNQPHCEKEEKLATFKKLAEIAGVDLKDLNL